MNNQADSQKSKAEMELVSQKEIRKLRKDILRHLEKLGLPKPDQPDEVSSEERKEAIRANHSFQRREWIEKEFQAFGRKWTSLAQHIADGSEIDPSSIRPELIKVERGTESGYLFRFACLFWSIPVSRGYGRRMRYLVRDRHNGKLIGLFALNDPVFNLRARDQWIGWNADDRRARLVNVMDAYVVGAVPPYSMLLGGKLVASLMGSKEVGLNFREKYASTKGIISKQKKDARLVLITVTSALGRSSLYNRLKLRKITSNSKNKTILELVRVGETRGYGHFQLSDELFMRIRNLLAKEEHAYANGHNFGQGPNWRMRVIRQGLRRVGLDEELLRHGVNREVYGMPLADAFKKFLRGERKRVSLRRPAARTISNVALERWVIPRAKRNDTYNEFKRKDIWRIISPDIEVTHELGAQLLLKM